MPESTLSDVLARAARSSRGVSFLDRKETASFHPYAEIHQRAGGVAGGLQSLGIRAGDVVALVLATSPDFYTAFFGVSMAGAVPVALYPPFRLGQLEDYRARTRAMLEASGARLLLTSRRMAGLFARSSDEAALELGTVAIEDLPVETPLATRVAPDLPALIQFSSGSTGEPRAVRLSHRHLLANVEAIQQAILSAYPESNELTHRAISWLPLYHDMGLVGSLLTSLAHPSDLILIAPQDFVSQPALWLRAISRYRGTVSAAPNFAYALCVDRVRDEDLAGVDLSSWLLALNGAEPVAPSVLRRFGERFRPLGLRASALTPVYGLSEAALAVTFSEPGLGARTRIFDRDDLSGRSGQAGLGIASPAPDGLELVSLGKPLPGYRVQIVDSAEQPVPFGHVGRVMVRGPSIASEWRTPDGWLDTGDAGFLFDGELYLYGRNKDLIVLRGRNYSPHDIELALNDVPWVRKGCSAALGIVPEEGEGEELVVLVERSRSTAAKVDPDLMRAVRRCIASRVGLVPEVVRVLDPGTLPRTTNGKIRRGEARRRYLRGSLTPPRRWWPWPRTEAILRSLPGWGRGAGS